MRVNYWEMNNLSHLKDFDYQDPPANKLKNGYEIGLNGWLSPDGIFYECEENHHIDKASEIVNERQYKMSKLNILEDDEQQLERLSFIKFKCPSTGCNGSKSLVLTAKETTRISDRQLEFVINNIKSLTRLQRDDFFSFIKYNGIKG